MINRNRRNSTTNRTQQKTAEPVRLQKRIYHDPLSNHETHSGGHRQAKNRSVSSRAVSGILSIFLGLAAAAFTYLPTFRIQKPVIHGYSVINDEEIAYYTGLNNLPFYQADPKFIRETLLKRYPEIRDVKINLSFPSSIEILMEQRKPIIEWDFGGSKFWIDEEGTVIKENSSDEELIYVLANSFPGAKSRSDRKIPSSFSKNVLQSIIRINEKRPKGKTLFYTYDNGFGWDTQSGYRLWLGKNSNALDEKLKMAESIQEYFKKEEIEPDMLSLEFTHAPYYRFSE